MIKKILSIIRLKYLIVMRYFYKRIVLMRVEKASSDLEIRNYTIVNNKTMIGKNVKIGSFVIDGKGKVEISDNTHISDECLFITDVHNYDNGKCIPYDDTYIIKNIKIEHNVWIGRRCVILGGVTIGEGAIIQAGSVVVNNIPKYAIAGGHPAKVFKYRNIEHYEKLKELKKFH